MAKARSTKGKAKPGKSVGGDSQILMFESDAGGAVMVPVMRCGDASHLSNEKPSLTFKRTNDKLVLTHVWVANGDYGFEILQPSE